MQGSAECLSLLTIATADANRSCGPPKPGRRLLKGVRRCRRRSAAGVRWVPTGPRRARGDAVACPGGPYINCAPIRDSRAIRRALSGPVVPKQGSDGNPSEPKPKSKRLRKQKSQQCQKQPSAQFRRPVAMSRPTVLVWLFLQMRHVPYPGSCNCIPNFYQHGLRQLSLSLLSARRLNK